LAVLILIPVVVAYAPDAYKERFMSTFVGREKEGHSKEGRIKMYGQGVEVFTRHPFGVGTGNYHLAGAKYYNLPQSMHCLYLEILTENGIQGFIVVMALFVKIFLVLKRLRLDLSVLLTKAKEKYSEDFDQLEDLKFLTALAHALLVYYLVRLFVDIFGMDLYGICWWFIIGTSSSMYLIIHRMKKNTADKDRLWLTTPAE
jgi:O-antigen ligase